MAKRRVRTVKDIPKTEEFDVVLAQIQKRMGEKTVTKGKDRKQPFRIPTNIFTFDFATLGGIPHNRVSMFHGKRHSGKTTASLRTIAGAQNSMAGKKAVLADIEDTYDATWGAKIGVDNENLYVIAPDSGEQAVDAIIGLAQARETSLIVVDSVAALLPVKEQEGSAEDSSIPGLQAKLITSMMRKITGVMIAERKRQHYISLLVINQERAKIMGYNPTGQAVSLPGGQALGFFTSLEARFKNKENKKQINGMDMLTMNEHAFAIEKNKMNAGARTGEFQMLRMDDEETGLAEGEIDDAGTMLNFAKRLGWYSGGGRRWTLDFDEVSHTVSNVEEMIRFLYQEPEIYWKLRCHLIANEAERQRMEPEFIAHVRGDV
jgi:recombination protein RecA